MTTILPVSMLMLNVCGVDLSDVWISVILLSAASLTKSSVRLSTVSACFMAKALLLITFKSSVCTVMVIILESADLFAVDFLVTANTTVVSALKRRSLVASTGVQRWPA